MGVLEVSHRGGGLERSSTRRTRGRVGDKDPWGSRPLWQTQRMSGIEKTMRQQERAAARRRERKDERQERMADRGAPAADEADAAPISADVFEEEATALASEPLTDFLHASGVYLVILHGVMAVWILLGGVTVESLPLPLAALLALATGWSLALLGKAARRHVIAPIAGVPGIETPIELRKEAAIRGTFSLAAALMWLWTLGVF